MKNNAKTNKLNNAIVQVLDWGYSAALFGGPGFEDIETIAQSYSKAGGAPLVQAQSLVRWQVGRAGALGFVTGLPGLPFLPATVPANLAGMLVLQLRMNGAVAVLGGHDPRDDQVKAFATMCLAGSAASEIAREFGITLSTKLVEKAVDRLSGKALIEINKRVGFRLATKFGEKGLINFGKAVPVVGGIVGGAFDAASTRIVGAAAINAFITK
jgi:hypothetical protein